MGCGCGGRKNASGVNPAQGANPSNPMVYGTDDPILPTRRVVLLQASAGIPAGATRYVRGSEVNSMLENGVLRATDGGKF